MDSKGDYVLNDRMRRIEIEEGLTTKKLSLDFDNRYDFKVGNRLLQQMNREMLKE